MNRRLSGKTNYLAGLAAEDFVAADYARRGHPVAARRWRGSQGELDLVLRDGAGLIVVEVKKASSFEQAASRITRRQLDRIYGAVSEFLAGEPAGSGTEVRLDVALVDQMGRLDIIENYWS